jgi:hypothetical protein
MRVSQLRYPLFAAVVALCPALSAVQPNPQALFNKIRERVAASMQDAHSYTCVETIGRSWYMQKYGIRPVCDVERLTEPQNLLLYKRDRLRLDVGIVQGEEVFSWHGESRFRTSNIDDLVTDGPIASGTFFSLLSSIFVTGHGRYFYHGLRGQGAAAEAVFTFQMSRSASRFTLHTPGRAAIISYQGTFTANESTGELTSVQVTTDDMPQSIHVCRLELNARYSQQTSQRAFNAPSSVEFQIFDQGGDIVRTSMEYQNCHQFTGSATIHFETAYDASAIGQVSVPTREIPPGLTVKVRLITPIDIASAWAGDAIEGELAAAITAKDGRILAAKGAMVTGRLLSCAHLLRPRDYWTIDLQFNRIHTPEADYRVLLQPKSRALRSLSASGSARAGVGSFQLPEHRTTLDRHFQTEWGSKPAKPQD